MTTKIKAFSEKTMKEVCEDLGLSRFDLEKDQAIIGIQFTKEEGGQPTIALRLLTITKEGRVIRTLRRYVLLLLPDGQEIWEKVY